MKDLKNVIAIRIRKKKTAVTRVLNLTAANKFKFSR